MRGVPSSGITIQRFQQEHAQTLELKLVAGASGLNRKIREGTVNRPGLALAGFQKHFPHRRVQVIGRAEYTYLQSFSQSLQRRRIRKLCESDIPCVVFARGLRPSRVFLQEAEALGVPIFRCPMITMRLINKATIILEAEFAPTVNEQGGMVDLQGIGVLIRGRSGIGKSECVLSLLERGYSLVADDITRIRLINGCELIGSSPEISRNHMEVRGIGIINVAAMFGVAAIRHEKLLNLVVSLVEWNKEAEIDRLGIDRQFYTIMGIKVPHVTIPVRPGRDLARLIEVAALDQKLKSMGHNTALEFNRRLLQTMQKASKSP
jgi:HPr kinase/phosphorylase